MDKSRVAELVGRFGEKRILVIGDLMLDEFLWGKVSRISPEAPVPVVEIVKEEFFPGGAANVARNLAEFTKNASLMGATGACSRAEILKKLLVSEGVGVDAIQFRSCYRTIVKTRVIARHQHVVRIDRETKTHLQAAHQEEALARLESMLPSLDAVIVEDYGKGVLEQRFTDEIARLVNKFGKVLAVDPNPNNPLIWRQATVIKPNRSEAFASAGIPFVDDGRHPMEDTALHRVGSLLMEKWDMQNLLITLGEQGVLLFRKGEPPYHAPTRAREVFDVSGAGDTVISLFTLALTAGAAAEEAAEIANHASGVVVGKLGTATVTPAELIASFEE